MRQLLIVEAQVESWGSLGFVVHEVVVVQASMTDHLRHDMVFVSGFEPEKNVIRNVALASMGMYLAACEYCMRTGTSFTVYSFYCMFLSNRITIW
jgi:hypothetical protein